MRKVAPGITFLLLGSCSANAQWEIEQSYTTADLRGIHSLDGMVAWASGALAGN